MINRSLLIAIIIKIFDSKIYTITLINQDIKKY